MAWLGMLLLLVSCAADEAAERPTDGTDAAIDVDAGLDAPNPLNDPLAQRVEPFRIFDDVYYIGIRWVSAYLIDTGAGLIMIDALYGDFVDTAIQDIRGLGFDPSDLEYVLVTHGHFDHNGGAGVLQERLGARIVMTEADWELTEGSDQLETPTRDIVAADGDEITLGNTTVRFYVTPGHTTGVLSMDLTVRDGDDEHRAFVFGGVGLNFEGVERTESYLRSVARIRSLAGEGAPIAVNLANHPGVAQAFERRDLLASRGAGDPHPFVDPVGYLAWLDEIETNAELKLAEEVANAER